MGLMFVISWVMLFLSMSVVVLLLFVSLRPDTKGEEFRDALLVCGIWAVALAGFAHVIVTVLK